MPIEIRPPGTPVRIEALSQAGGTYFLLAAATVNVMRWDPSGTAGVQDGSGTWDTTTANWTDDNGATNKVWNASNVARFGGGSSGTAGTVTVSGTVEATGLLFDAPNAGVYTLSGGVVTLTGDAEITVASGVEALVQSRISGSAGLKKKGAGTAVVSNGSNNYTGGTRIEAGVFRATGGTAFGSGNITLAGGTLYILNESLSVSPVVDGSGTVWADGAAYFNMAGSNTYAGVTKASNNANLSTNNANGFGSSTIRLDYGTLSMDSNITIPNPIEVVPGAGPHAAHIYAYGSASTVFSGPISGSGLLKFGTESGYAILSGDMSAFSGTYQITGVHGRFRASGGVAGSAAATFAVWAGSVLRLDDSAGTNNSTFHAGALVGNSYIYGTMDGGSGTRTLSIGARNEFTTYSGTILDNNGGSAIVAVTKVGTGQQVLTGNSEYTGPTTIVDGSISIPTLANGGSNSPIGKSSNAASNLVFDGALDYVPELGAVSVHDSGLMYSGSTASCDRNFTIPDGRGGTLGFNGTGTMTWSGGSAATTGHLRVETFAGGTIFLSGALQHTGTTYFQGGEIHLTGSLNNASTRMVAVKAGNLAAYTAHLVLADSPMFTGQTFDIITNESATVDADAVTWAGTETGTPTLKVNGATVTSGVATAGGTTVTFDSTNKRIRVQHA